MPDRYDAHYAAINDAMWYSRGAFREAVLRLLQENHNHLHGTRVQHVVSQTDLWFLLPAVASTTPEWHVTISPGAARLRGTVIWLPTNNAGRGRDTANIEVQFYSERGGVGVAGGLDTVTSGIVTNSALVRGWVDAREDPRALAEAPRIVHDGQSAAVTTRTWIPRFLTEGNGQGNTPRWIRWSPNLTTSNEQRIQCRVRYTLNSGGYLWGVMIYEEVPLS